MTQLTASTAAHLPDHAELVDRLTEWLDALASDWVRVTLQRALFASHV